MKNANEYLINVKSNVTTDNNYYLSCVATTIKVRMIKIK